MNIFSVIFLFWAMHLASGAEMMPRLVDIGLKDVPQNVLDSGVLERPVVFGYTYETGIDPSKIPWKSLTHLLLAFFDIDQLGNVTSKNPNLQSIIDPAHKNGVKIIASIGGAGSTVIGNVLADKTARARLTTSVVDNIRQHGLDGIDYDYEFPETTQQIDNLLAGLKSARSAIDSAFGKGKKELTTTLFSSKGQFGPNVPAVDAKPFSDVVDYGLLMSYDYFGSFSEVSAPNSPFYDIPNHPGLSFTSSIAAWQKMGWDPKKLVAGLPYYGRTTIINGSPAGRSQFMPSSGVAPPGGPVDKIAGAWTWTDLRDPRDGALDTPTTAHNGWQRFWDKTTQTPWLYHNVSQTYIGYDDVDSLSIKARHIIDQGLVGAMIWMVQYDFDDELNSVVRHYSAACTRISKQAAELLEQESQSDSFENSDDEEMADSEDADSAELSSIKHLNSPTAFIKLTQSSEGAPTILSF
ncbi:hypothetical protein GGI07_003609 [Coemansia sp. Benny D115]|nr:hypothetical protein GGI07_003609 [Coemansia sp. Benny D115]